MSSEGWIALKLRIYSGTLLKGIAHVCFTPVPDSLKGKTIFIVSVDNNS